MKTIAVLNGPNLNRLGLREPEVYGKLTLADLQALLEKEAASLGVQVVFFQSNHEGELIDKIYAWADAKVDGLIINGGAFTHTSVALRDAIAGSGLTAVEVHISNIYQREEFRHHSYTAPVCKGVITGLGFHGYVSALRYF
ncbi:MAG: type II 3-dehydroquinate dehydratase [Verrucomicrobiota bacterium]|nr:type II 3-dehydroquinate dehydratase [Verrucomicrobiota bacterium]